MKALVTLAAASLFNYGSGTYSSGPFSTTDPTVLTTAQSTNSSGTIWTFTPEEAVVPGPVTAALVTFGLMGLFGFRRKYDVLN